MKLNRFETVSGTYIEKISGQSRIGYSLSDSMDFYDIIEHSKKGDYHGSVISFYDYENGKVYEPFSKQRNVSYGHPIYSNHCFWLLQGDYNYGIYTLYKYLPGEIPQMITQLNAADVNPYNLRIIGEEVHITSEDDDFVCYYPEHFSFIKASNESVMLIANRKVYLSAWIEEGWDDENDCASEEYKYYEKVIVRDFNGNILSEEFGSLNQYSDGSWWIS